MRSTRTFPATSQSVAAARTFAIEALAGNPPELMDAVELMVSELATNAISHVHTSFEITVAQTGTEIRVEVRDHGGGTPQKRSPGPDIPHGRGLRIVEMLSDRWGVQARSPAGKVVWFSLRTPMTSTRSAAQTRSSGQPADVRPDGSVLDGSGDVTGPAGILRSWRRDTPVMSSLPARWSAMVGTGGSVASGLRWATATCGCCSPH